MRNRPCNLATMLDVVFLSGNPGSAGIGSPVAIGVLQGGICGVNISGMSISVSLMSIKDCFKENRTVLTNFNK